jgi:Pseudouridylate synthases, 23S RNA-specific
MEETAKLTYSDIKILFEDNHLLVVVKPQNLPTQADESGDTDLLTLMKQYLKEKYDKKGEAYLGMVHRLDRPTGGVIVFAKTSKAAARLSDAIQNGEVDKKYLAVVYDTPRDKQRVLINYLKKDTTTNNVYVVPELTEGAKYAELSYRVLKSLGKASLLSVKLVTGRSHQIRVQLAHIKHPIVGDLRYSGNRPKANCNLGLWAAELRFKHPVTDDIMVFRVYPPEEERPWNYFNLEPFFALTVKDN